MKWLSLAAIVGICLATAGCGGEAKDDDSRGKVRIEDGEGRRLDIDVNIDRDKGNVDVKFGDDE